MAQDTIRLRVCFKCERQGVHQMTWSIIAGIAGGIVLLGNAGAVIYKWINPALKMKDDVKELDRRSKNDYEAIQKLEKAIERNEVVNKLQLEVMLNMLNHMIDGNGVEEMKETRKQVQSLLAGHEV